jgi:F1F0 ATPase subunit 2
MTGVAEMNELLQIMMTLIAGMLLGALYFGSLWWTVRKGLSARQPALWFVTSLLLRTAVALAGFYFVAGPDWKRLLFCLLGFIIARMIVIRLTAKRMLEEVIHAP